MPEDKEKTVQKEQMVDLDTSGPEVDIALPEEKEQSVEQEVTNAETDNKDSDKPDIHLRNLMSSWMLHRANQKLRKRLQKKGIVSQQTTVAQLKNILRGLRKE